ncbi:hypothetical protein ACWD46_28450 [Streptomyces sp. NPDC002486]
MAVEKSLVPRLTTTTWGRQVPGFCQSDDMDAVIGHGNRDCNLQRHRPRTPPAAAPAAAGDRLDHERGTLAEAGQNARASLLPVSPYGTGTPRRDASSRARSCRRASAASWGEARPR